jgi:hypothetical protein
MFEEEIILKTLKLKIKKYSIEYNRFINERVKKVIRRFKNDTRAYC